MMNTPVRAPAIVPAQALRVASVSSERPIRDKERKSWRPRYGAASATRRMKHSRAGTIAEITVARQDPP